MRSRVTLAERLQTVDGFSAVARPGRAARTRGPAPRLTHVRTLADVSDDSGRKYVIPDDPSDRPVRTRRAVRVIVVGPDDRVLLFEDSDPGIPGVTWWVTPGGGMDPGESERATAVREMAEETGYLLDEAALVGPLATRYAVHGYSDQILDQQEPFYLAVVSAFEIDISAHTEEEKFTLQGHRWLRCTGGDQSRRQCQCSETRARNRGVHGLAPENRRRC